MKSNSISSELSSHQITVKLNSIKLNGTNNYMKSNFSLIPANEGLYGTWKVYDARAPFSSARRWHRFLIDFCNDLYDLWLTCMVFWLTCGWLAQMIDRWTWDGLLIDLSLTFHWLLIDFGLTFDWLVICLCSVRTFLMNLFWVTKTACGTVCK